LLFCGNGLPWLRDPYSFAKLTCWMLLKRSTVPELIFSTERRPFTGADLALQFEMNR